MKKLTMLILAFLCVLGTVGCDSRSYTCRIATAEDDLKLQPSELSEPFVTDKERDELLTRAIEDYLKSMGEEGTSFTYEILDTHLGICQEKETVVYFVRVVYGEGFTFLSGFVVQ